MTRRKNPSAVSLGRRGGFAKALKMTAEERSQNARRMVAAREARRSRPAVDRQPG